MLPGARQVTVAPNLVQGILLLIRKCKGQEKKRKNGAYSPIFLSGYVNSVSCLVTAFFVQN